MSTESIDRRLHRLHDGDLSAEERAELEQEMAAQPELAKKLEGLREVGVVVRAARTDAEPIDGEALWKAIESQIVAPVGTPSAEPQTTQTPARPALRAIIASPTPPAMIIGGAETRPAEDARARRRRYTGIGVGLLAIAAAALLMFYGPPDEASHTIAESTPPEPDTTAPESTTPDAPQVVASATDYTEVLAVDFGTNVGTIFAVEGEGGQRYAVVWLDDVLKQGDGDAPAPPESTPD